MPVRRTDGPTPDLFAAVAGKTAPAASQETAPQPNIAPTIKSSLPRYLLPKDLAGALSRLDDADIDSLLAAVTHEAERRRRLPTKTIAAERADRSADRAPSPAPPTEPPRPAHVRTVSASPSLPRGQVNAVRAAFLAGVKPSAIARQFGISQAAVKQVLATLIGGRKS